MKTKSVDFLHNLPFFTKNSLRMMVNETNNTLSVSVKRLLDKGRLIKLKNGFYTTKYYYEKNGDSDEYREFLASALCQPSYLSLEYVLGKQEMITEGVKLFTSVSLKTTRSFENQLGSFVYKNLSKRLFTGYEERFFRGNSYFLATKAKALFDWLYFLTNEARGVNNQNYQLIKEKRLRMDRMKKADWQEMKRYIKITSKEKAAYIKLQFKPYAPNL